jgi:uncharacterized membrane protein
MALPISRLRVTWARLRASYWFVPTLMALAAIGLAAGMIELDHWMDGREMTPRAWLYGGRAEGAQTMLSTIASSMITVAGVAFSITIVALVLASNKFGPRLLRNFMRDLGNQLVLGTFIATYVYCLLVLRSVRSGEDLGGVFVPHAAVSTAVVFALGSLGVLIYFIHHVASSINAAHAVAGVGTDFVRAIDRLFPEPIGDDVKAHAPEPPEWALPTGFENASVVVAARRGGYVEAVDDQTLVRVAREHDVVVVLEHEPGSFVVQGAPLMHVWPAPRDPGRLCESLTAAVAIGSQRTLTQDAEFAVVQLVEVALRALSPGINEPFTAINCLDWLAQGLSRVAQREEPSRLRTDEAGRVRVVAPRTTFAGLVDASFSELDRYALASVTVTERMMEVFGVIGSFTHREADRGALRRHVEQLWRRVRESFGDPREIERIAGARAAALDVLRAPPEAERPPAVH